VLPRVEPLLTGGGEGGAAEEDLADGSGRGIGGVGLDTGAIEFELDGLRPYRDGTPASRIHWPSVARTGELLEIKLVTGGRDSPLIVLDASDPVDEECLDKAVRAAASLCFHLAATDGCAILMPGEARLLEIDTGLRSWPAVHARLALVEAGMRLPRMRHQPGGEVFWVTGAASPPPQARPGSREAARGYVVSPAIAGGPPPAFTVAGCSGVRLEAVLRSGAHARARAA
jgi:uncharacterized protein (DUF58 family)